MHTKINNNRYIRFSDFRLDDKMPWRKILFFGNIKNYIKTKCVTNPQIFPLNCKIAGLILRFLYSYPVDQNK